MAHKATGYVVNHTHWDREWYFSSMDSLVLSDQLFTEVLEQLEQNELATFCLDGQSSILEDYLSIYPEKKDLVKKLLKNNQLFAGPWYTQTDGFIPSGEAILRNLMIGTRDANQMGKSMAVGYLPDTFGFNAQMPTLLQHAGLDNIIFWRGSEFGGDLKSPYFKWKGLGNQKVIAANIPQSYSAASLIEATSKYAETRLNPIMEMHAEMGESDVLIPSGADQLNIVPDFNQVVSELSKYTAYHLEASTYPEFIEKLRSRELPSYEGDFRSPKFARLHQSISSVRYSIKNETSKVQNKLINEIEPLVVLGECLDIHTSVELLVKAWKKVLESQAHDSLGGCITDSVAQDILHRLKEADELCDGIKNTILFKMHEKLELGERDLLLVNPTMNEFYGYKTARVVLPHKQFEIDDVEELSILSETFYPTRKNVLKLTAQGHQYIDEPEYYILDIRFKVKLPPFGYRSLHINTNKQRLIYHQEGLKTQIIKNKYVSLEFKNNELFVNSNGKEYTDFLRLVDQGNDGDTYDFSPLRGDQEISLSWKEAKVSKIGDTQIITLMGTEELPEKLNDRVNKRNMKTINYEITLSLDADSPRIQGKVRFENQIYSHRLRLKINTNVAAPIAYSQIQVGFQRRVNKKISDDWESYYPEKPVNLYNFQRTVTHTNEVDKYISFYTRNLYEYEIDHNRLFITLLATTGQFGKPDLTWRPGRASGDTTMAGHVMVDTPDAEELGEYVNTFAILVSDLWMESSIVDDYQKWSLPSITYQKQSFNLSLNRLDNKLQKSTKKAVLPKEFSLLTGLSNIVISSIAPSILDKKAYLVRLVNETATNIDFKGEFTKDYEVVNAIEEVQKSTSTIAPYDYVTLKFKYK